MSESVLSWRLKAKDDASDEFAKVGRSAAGLSAGMKNLAFGAGVALAAAGIAAVKFSGDAIEAYAQAEQAQNRLNFAFDKFPALSGANADELRKLNTGLQNTTRFEDDAIAAAQGALAQYDLTAEQLKELTPLMLDYAAATGKDVSTAADDMGKAILGQGRALKAIGFDFKDAESPAANYAQLIAGLSQKVQGFAEKDAETLVGKLDQIKNRFGDVQETFGEALSPFADLGLDFLENSALPALQGMADTLSTSGLGDQLALLGPSLGDAFSSLVDTFSTNLPNIIDGLDSIATSAPAAIEAVEGFFNFVGNGDLGPAANDFSLGDWFQELEDNLDRFHGVATEAEEEAAAAMLKRSDLLKAQWRRTIGDMKDDLIAAGMYEAGYDFAEGFALGIADGSYLAEVQAENMALRAAAKASYAMEARSPSMLMRRKGRFVPEGFALGIEDGIPLVERAASRMVAGLGSVASSYGAPTVMPAAGGSLAVNTEVHVHGSVLGNEDAIAQTVSSAVINAVRRGQFPTAQFSQAINGR